MSDRAKNKLRNEAKLATEVTIAIIEEGLRTRAIDGKIDDPLILRRYLFQVSRKLRSGKFFGAIDHRETLLRESKRYSRQRSNELALLLFATWIEHFVNSLIEGHARRMSIPLDEVADILRSTQIKAKVTWLLRLVGLPPMAPTKANAIIKIMEARNGFVHYKWKLKDIDAETAHESVPKLGYKIRTISKYLETYERKNVIGYSKSDLVNALGRLRGIEK